MLGGQFAGRYRLFNVRPQLVVRDSRDSTSVLVIGVGSKFVASCDKSLTPLFLLFGRFGLGQFLFCERFGLAPLLDIK
jgi:hypothetical protein